MWKSFCVLAASLQLSRAFFGLEEVQVKFITRTGISYPFEDAVITVVPHTSDVVIWSCTQSRCTVV